MKAKTSYQLTPMQARTMLLAAQGLIEPPKQASKEDVRAAIRQMQVLQIDTINVINRSPYLVLWSRIGAFPLDWLTDLLAERAIFEYWSHAACFLPIEDYSLYRGLMFVPDPQWSAPHRWRTKEWIAEHPEIIDRVMSHIRSNGSGRSSDFENKDGRKGSWWNWKEEKVALEILFVAGEIMIAQRDKFQRVYDLRERIIGEWDDSKNPSLDTVQREFILRTVKALGVAHSNWIADYFRVPKSKLPPLVANLLKEGALVPVTVDGWAGSFYIHRDQQPLVEDVLSGKIVATRTTLLSPFDPVIWDRARLMAMFGFEYQIEVYTPGPKRKYGYFTLPILHGSDLVGRLDPKVHRKEKRLEIRAIHLEPEVAVTDELVSGLTTTLEDFALWHDAQEILIQPTAPKAMIKALKKAKPKLVKINFG